MMGNDFGNILLILMRQMGEGINKKAALEGRPLLY